MKSLSWSSMVVFAILFGTSCASVEMKTPKDPRMKKRWVNNLARIVEKETGCPKNEMAYSYEDGIQVIEGCGKKSEYVLVVGVSGKLPSGFASIGELRKRAAFDLGCQEENLALTKLSDTSWGVTGCEQKASYVLLPGVNGHADYEWILNSDSKPGESNDQPKTT